MDRNVQLLGPRLNPDRLPSLRRASEKLAQCDVAHSVRRWLVGSEATACRVGLMVGNDLASAATVIRALPIAGSHEESAEKKIQDLTRFSVSEIWFDLQRTLTDRR